MSSYSDTSPLSVPAVFEPQRHPVAEREPQIVSDAPTPQRSAAWGKTKLMWAGLPALGVLLVAGLTIWYFATSKTLPRDDPPGVSVPLTSYAGFQSFPTFSPEGTRVAFAWEDSGKGQSGIYVKLIGSPEPLRLTSSNNGDFAPAWSPDGRSVAFLRVRGWQMCDVVLVPSLGGSERNVAHLRFDGARVLGHILWVVPSPYIAWSLDSKWLLSLEQSGPDQAARIVRISVETGEKALLLPLSGGTDPKGFLMGSDNGGLGGLAISPDGRQLAFVNADLPSSTAYVVSVSEDLRLTGRPQRLSFKGAAIGGVAWDFGGRSLIVSSNRRGLPELWKIPVTPPGEPRLLNVKDDSPTDIAVSAAGRHLVYTHRSDDSDIWGVGLAGTHLNQPAAFIASTRIEIRASYAADGKRVAFESGRSGNEEVWISDADGSHTAQLTHFENAYAGSPKWSPDGQWIAFDCNAGGQWHVYVIRTEGGKPVRLTTSSAREIRPSWSNDGRWIYYSSSRSGDAQIWKKHANEGGEIQVTRNGGVDSFESPDSAYVYYGNSENALWRVPAAGGDETELLGPNSMMDFTVTKKGVYLVDGQPAPNLKFLDIRTRLLRKIGSLPGPFVSGLAISPDERWLLYSKGEAAGSQLMLVDNFR
jgi:Tol biopolymer transport system component